MDQLSPVLFLYLLVICWLICVREQTIAYATAPIADTFYQSFMYSTTWSVWSNWTTNTLNFSTLQAFQHFSLACKIQFLKTCPNEFIRFLSECIVNLLQGSLSEVRRIHILKYRDEVHELFSKGTIWKQRRSLLSSQKGLMLIKTISPSSIIICLEMTQFVLVPLSVYNSSNNSTIVTKQELPKYKPEKKPTYHKGTLKKEIYQQLSTCESALVNKTLQSPRIKLSNSKASILDETETGVLLTDFAQRLKRKNVSISNSYFTLLDAASITPEIVVNSHAKGKERGAWIAFKIWTTKIAEILHARICSMWFCAQFGKSSETLSVKAQRVLTFRDFIYKVHISNT